MNRNEVFSSLGVASICVKLVWARLEVMTDDTQDVQLLISGSDEDVNRLKVSYVNGVMSVEQPVYRLPPHLMSSHWMDIVLRLPKSWKGEARFSAATSGSVNVRGFVGTDLSVSTVLGDITASHLNAMTCVLQTVEGKLSATDVQCDQLQLRAVCSNVKLESGSFSQGRISNVTGEINLSLDQPFDWLEANTISGSIWLDAPLSDINVRHKTVSGHLRVAGAEITESGVPITVSSVSGDLEILGIHHDET